MLLLTGFLATILMRVLKNDFMKYSRDEEAGALPGLTGPGVILALGVHLWRGFFVGFHEQTWCCVAAAGDDGDEGGWKHLHGDVFRFPAHPSLFSAMVGSGEAPP